MAKKTQKAKSKRRYTPRQTRKFQLRQDHAVDLHVGEVLNYARTQRREVTMIRDGVRLLWALENNDLSVLFSLFPHLQKQFIPEGADLLEQFKQMMLQARPVEQPSATTAPQPKLLPAFKPLALSLSDDDDDQDTLVLKKSTVNTSSNFLAGMMSFK